MNDPLVWFLECHERMRRFTLGLERLVALPDLQDPRVAPAAAQAGRYYKEGLPLHGEDEDVSLAPRLRVRGIAPAVEAALERMEADHVLLHAGLPNLIHLLDLAAAGTPPDRAALREASAWISGLLFPHMDIEETVIFPAMTVLTAEDRAAMLGEMRARRGLTG